MPHRITLLLCLFVLPLSLATAQDSLQADPERMEQRIKALSAFGANADGGVDRIAFSDADLAGRAYIMNLMREVGLSVRLDTAGNIIGRREGTESICEPNIMGGRSGSLPSRLPRT